MNEGDKNGDNFVTKHVGASTMTDELDAYSTRMYNDDKMVKFYTRFSSFN